MPRRSDAEDSVIGAQPRRAVLPFPVAWAAAVPELDGVHKPIGLMLASAFVLSASVQLSGALGYTHASRCTVSGCVAEGRNSSAVGH